MDRVVRLGASLVLSFLCAVCCFGVPQAAPLDPRLLVVDPSKMVMIEHRDRVNRLNRLSQLDGIEPPQMSTDFVSPSEHGLSDYPINIPVLHVVFRDGVLFDFNRDEVRPEAMPVLGIIAKSLQLEPPDVTVFIAGHTDAIGSVEYNLGLGLRRAKAVAAALATIGVNQAHIFAISFGKATPVAPNDTDEGRARNRRVEFLFAARQEAVAATLLKLPIMPCGDSHYTAGQECPTHHVFIGVAPITVSLAPPPPVLVPLPHHPTIIPPGPGKTPVPLPTPRTTIQFQEHVVTIDLTQHHFSFPPPVKVP